MKIHATESGCYQQGLPDAFNATGTQAQEISGLFNDLVRQLRAAFPASLRNIQSQEDMNEFRRQWLLAFAENGITSIAQINAGMRIARQQNRPYIPSPGMFIDWIREGERQASGLPTENELVKMVHAYCVRRGYYKSPANYPWKHAAHYWMVTALYSGMAANSWSDAELKRHAIWELDSMTKRLNRGEEIPAPVPLIAEPVKKILTKEQNLSRIAELRQKHGLPKRNG